MTFTQTYSLPGLELPVLCAGNQDHHSAVVVLHGLNCYKEKQQAELDRLSAAGFFAMAVDAPHHGERTDGAMDVFNRLNGYERHHFLLASVLQHASEISGLVEELRKKYTKVAVMGISMGGHSVFAMLRLANRPDLLAPFLATPDFRARNLADRLPVSPLESTGPIDHVEEVFPAPLFMVTAGSDSVVRPVATRKFHELLLPIYQSCPELLEYHEYPESDHLMRAEDWYDAWRRFVERLGRDGF
ncbi:MAG: alpha/beta fold hydrolase [Candidatus Riflebacteria bacterium]|nr:alpha/beta fold hydrolase [Candidatus Riflebacteria bacterium]